MRKTKAVVGLLVLICAVIGFEVWVWSVTGSNGHRLGNVAYAGDEKPGQSAVAPSAPPAGAVSDAAISALTELRAAVDGLTQKCEDLSVRIKKAEDVAAEERSNASHQQKTKNGWCSARDWDGKGEKPYGYIIGVTRRETVPEERFFKKYVRDLPRGMEAWVREDALRIDNLRRGWLRADALVADGFLPEFPVRVTRWDGGYYVYPPRSFQFPDPTFIGGEPAWIRVQQFCWDEGGMVQYVLEMPSAVKFNFDGLPSEPDSKKPAK